MNKARIKGQHLLSRLGGITIPGIGGASFKFPESERDVVRQVVIFFEDKRALYEDFALEIEDHVIQSLLQVRKELTDAMKRVSSKSPAYRGFELMRAECRQFLTGPRGEFRHVERHSPRGGMDAGFFAALGKLRGVFGERLAELAYLYDVDIGAELARILPPEPQADDGDVTPERRHWRY